PLDPPMELAEIAAPDFDLAMTLDSGQVFHWEKTDNGFCGTIGNVPVYVEQRGDALGVRAKVASASLRSVGSTSQRSSRCNKDHGQDAYATKLLIRNYFAL